MRKVTQPGLIGCRGARDAAAQEPPEDGLREIECLIHVKINRRVSSHHSRFVLPQG
jgi:hypothetical protein